MDILNSDEQDCVDYGGQTGFEVWSWKHKASACNFDKLGVRA